MYQYHPSNLTNKTFIPSNNPFRKIKCPPRIQCTLGDLRTRIQSIKTTEKITEAMKLVSAARVRKAQQSALNSRPFSQSLFKLLHQITLQLTALNIQLPFTQLRTPLTRVALVVVTSDKGLCGGFNNAVLKRAEERITELKKSNIECVVVSVGKKGNMYFKRNENGVHRFFETGLGVAKDAQVIADYLFSMFVSEEVDKVELVYTRFVSLVKSEPVICTILPMCGFGEEDEAFRLTSRGGKLAVERDVVRVERDKGMVSMEFEQDPVQIVDALMPLYLNNQVLRALQESLASEFAARMNAMSNATDNAVELSRNLSVAYNRQRQAKITGEILELVAGADALAELD